MSRYAPPAQSSRLTGPSPMGHASRYPSPIGYGSYGPSRQKLFLMVDDNRINRLLMSKIMKKLGQPHDVAENGEMALEMYSKDPQRYAAIFMDLIMPVMGGLEATRQIRLFEQAHGLSRITIILLHVHVHSASHEIARESGADLSLNKPLGTTAIKNVVARVRALQLEQALFLRRRFGAKL